MWRFNRRWFLWFLSLALLAGSVVALRIGQRPSGPPGPTLPEDDWDIPRLLAHLNARGLQLEAIPTYKDGPLFPSAFFTTVDRDWAYFNGLSRDTRQIEPWQGIVFCGLRGQVENADVDYLRDDRYHIAGRFFFYGDRALLQKIRAAFQEPTS